MKNTFFYKGVILLFVVAFLFSGCYKENELKPQITEVEQLQAKEISNKELLISKALIRDKIISCYGEVSTYIGKGSFEDVHGTPNDIGVRYIAKDGTEAFVFPLLKNNVVSKFLILNKEDEPFILKNVPALSLSETNGTGLTLGIVKPFEIGGYISTDILTEKIINQIGYDYFVQQDGNVLIIEEKQTIDYPVSSSMSKGIASMCEEGINMMLPYYSQYFGLGSQYDALLFEAILASHPSSQYCVCPVQWLVLENLIPTIQDMDVRDDLIEMYIIETGFGLGFDACESTFNNFTSTGLGATINLECIRFTFYFFTVDLPPDYDNVCYEMPNLCIATGQFEIIDGVIDPNPIGSNTRKFHTTNAYNHAAEVVKSANAVKFGLGQPYLTDLEASTMFKDAFQQELSTHLTGVAISNGPCSGAIGTGIPEYDYFGQCFTTSCTCD